MQDNRPSSQFAPQFLVNPECSPTLWAGESWGFHPYPNRSYLNSLWLGTVWNLMCLPDTLWTMIKEPTLLQVLLLMPLNALKVLIIFVSQLWAGLTGQLIMLNIPPQIALRTIVMSQSEARRALEMGLNQPLMRINKE